MLAWLLELAAAIAVAAVGVVLWSLPTDTPIIGRPPLVVGWVVISIGLVIAALSSAGRVGLEVQSPVRRRVLDPQPDSTTPPPHDSPLPAQPKDQGRALGEGEVADITPQDLVRLANTADLTAAQIDALIAPHRWKWLVIEGRVREVYRVGNEASVDGDASMRATAYFLAGKDAERALSLLRGVRRRLGGKISSASRYSNVTLVNCEFID
jgi:hypothetical protein